MNLYSRPICKKIPFISVSDLISWEGIARQCSKISYDFNFISRMNFASLTHFMMWMFNCIMLLLHLVIIILDPQHYQSLNHLSFSHILY